MEGITGALFRRTHRRFFPGVDRYFMPFLSPSQHHVFTRRELRDILPEQDGDLDAVPQLLTRSGADFLWAAGELARMGYREVNLNLGCPSGTVTAKGKGAGFLAKPEELDRFFDEVFAKIDIPVSVKTRLGIASPEEFGRLLEVYDRYPIACLTIHARVQKEKYRGPVHLDAFARALAESRNPVCYNGDLRTVEEVRALEARFPAVDAVMIGRGAVADPALVRKLRGGPAATKKELQAFTQALYRAYQDYYGQVGTAAQRMREVWFYLIHLFEDAERLNKKLRRFRNPGEYEVIEAAIFRELDLRDHAEGDLI